jgi:hypothetical protein
MMLFPKDEFHCDLVYTIVSTMANIFLWKNISPGDEIVMMLPKIYKKDPAGFDRKSATPLDFVLNSLER